MVYICQNKNCDLYQDPVSEKRASMNNFICDGCDVKLNSTEKDNYIFYEEAFSEFPTPIAREYHRLKEILEAGKPVSAMLQLKDLVEITLKTIVSLGLSDLYTNPQSKQEEKKKITPDLLTPQGIALGGWVKIGQELSKLKYLEINKHKFSDFLRFFYDAFTIDHRKSSSVDKKKPVKTKPFVAWRNDLLGHGALRLDENSYLQDVRDYLIFLDYVFRQELNFFKDWEMRLKDKDKTLLKGINVHLTAEHMAHDKVKTEYIDIELFSLSLYPFMRLEKCPAPGCNQKDIFLFDSDRNKKCYFLDYFRGHKFDRKEEYEAEIANLKTFIPKDYKFTYITFEINKTLNDILYSRSFEEEFIPPNFLYEELKKVLTLKSGYFYLISEGGTGKSYFVKGLEGEIGVSTVLSFYIKRKLHDHLHQFVMEIDERAKSKLGRVSVQIQLESAKNPEKLGQNFTKWAETLIRENYINRLVIAIDGIDDLPEPPEAEPSLLDIFPFELPENCYVVFTSRTKVPSFAQRTLEKLKQQKNFYTFTLKPDENDSYQALLGKYLEENLKEDLKTEENIKRIINKADSRFLYVYHFKNLLNEGIVIKDTEHIPSFKELYPGYMELLLEKFSQVGQKNYLHVILLLTASFQPLTAEMIGDMLHIREENVIPALCDFAEFLKSDRREETYYDIAHNEFEEYLKEKYNDDFKNMHFSLATQLIGKYKGDWKEVNWDSPSESYLMEELLEHAEMSGDKELFNYILTDEYLAFNYFGKGLEDNKKNRYRRSVKLFFSVIKIYENLVFNLGSTEIENELAAAYVNLGNALSVLTRNEEAVKKYKKAIEIIERLVLSGSTEIENDLAAAYMNLGNALRVLTRNEEAVKEYKKSIEIRERLVLSGRTEIENDLAAAYMNLGVSLRDLTHNEEAVEEYKKSIEILERLVLSGRTEIENVLALSYMNLGISLRDLTHNEEAVEKYKKSIEIMEKLVLSGRTEIENEVARAYMYLGVSFRALTRNEEAVEEYKKSIEILERLILSGRTEIENDLAGAYMNLGVSLRDLTHNEEAVEEYNKAIEILERLVRAGRTEIENELAGAYMNLGLSLNALTRYEEAIKEYNKAIEIREKLLEKSQFCPYPNLFMCYGNMILLGSNEIDYRKYAMNSASKVISILLNLSVNGNMTQQITGIGTQIFEVILRNHLFTSEQEEDVDTLSEVFGITKN